MNELTIILVVSLVGGTIFGAWATRVMLKEIGLPPDERAMEIDKLAALRTLELVLLADVVLLFYNLFVTRDQEAIDVTMAIFATVFFGGWFFRWYYARRM